VRVVIVVPPGPNIQAGILKSPRKREREKEGKRKEEREKRKEKR
jgi:hypothetical protein